MTECKNDLEGFSTNISTIKNGGFFERSASHSFLWPNSVLQFSQNYIKWILHYFLVFQNIQSMSF